MPKMKFYGYDVYYRLKTTSVLLVAARNKEEAKEEALRQLENMSQAELIERFVNALNFEPEFEIKYVERVDRLTDEDEAQFK